MNLRVLSRFALILLAAGCGGCLSVLFPAADPDPPVTGFLFTDVTYPLTLNHKGEKASGLQVKNDVKEIRMRVSFVDLQVMWDSNAIGDIARANGIADIYFADLHVLSVLFGLWNQYEVVIVGDPSPPPKEGSP